MPVRELVGTQTLTVSSTAVSLTLPAGRTPAAAHIVVENNPIRFWAVLNATPTSSQGYLVNPGEEIDLIDSEQVSAFKAIRSGSADAVLQISYGNRWEA